MIAVRRTVMLLIVIVILSLLWLPGTVKGDGYAGCPSAEVQAQHQGQIVDLMNRDRAARGLAQLTVNDRLIAAAQRSANDLAAHNFLSHQGSDGSTFSQRISAAGYRWRLVGENILWMNWLSASDASQMWMQSPGHRENILYPDFREVGVAMACNDGAGRYFYAMELGLR